MLQGVRQRVTIHLAVFVYAGLLYNNSGLFERGLEPNPMYAEKYRFAIRKVVGFLHKGLLDAPVTL